MGNVNLEQIVRPYIVGVQPTPGFQTARFAPPDANLDEEIVWGSSGDNIFQAIAKRRPEFDMDNENEEIKRKFDVVRIKDPNNSDNHLDVEVMTQYVGRNKIDKTRTTIDLARTEPSENVEIISRDNTRVSST